MGAKNFGMTLRVETKGKQTFWRDIPGFCGDILELLEKKKKCVCVCSIFGPYLGPGAPARESER